jgi:hypothetical protein
MLADRVKESSTTTGTGNITLGGTTTGYQTFNTAFGTSVEFYYVIDDGAGNLEIGIGHLSSSTTLVRDKVLYSTNANALVSFAAGTKTVYCDCPAEYLEQAIITDTDGATITFDLSQGSKHVVTLGGNRTLALSNVKVGQKFMIKIIQDGTGSRTVTWFTTIKWSGGTAPTLTTTASKGDWFGFICTSSGNYDGFILGQNY